MAHMTPEVRAAAAIVKDINLDDVIPGLYVAGETAGLYYGKYPGGTSVLRGLVFGKRAGEHAASYVSDLKKLGV